MGDPALPQEHHRKHKPGSRERRGEVKGLLELARGLLVLVLVIMAQPQEMIGERVGAHAESLLQGGYRVIVVLFLEQGRSLELVSLGILREFFCQPLPY